MEETFMSNMFNFDLQCFANKSGSNADDLYVGAGKWYTYPWVDGVPQRDNLTMIGDVGEATLSTDITSIEHRSSMDKYREVMASVNTEVTQKLALTLYEFDPVNLAMGLYGKEGIVEQAEATLSKKYTVSPDSNIRLMDDDGNSYMNVDTVAISLGNPTPAEIGAATGSTSNTSDGTVTSSGSYTGKTDTTYYIQIKSSCTVPGTIDGCTFVWGKGDSIATALQGAVAIDADGTEQSLDEGVYVKFEVTGTQDFKAGDTFTIKATSASGDFVIDKDFLVNEVDSRAGIINIPKGSSIPENTEVIVSFHVPKMKAPKIIGGTVDKIVKGLVFIGDPNLGPCYNMEAWKVAIKPNGDTGLIGTDFGSFQLECTLMSDRANHPKEPLYTMAKVASN